MNEKEIISEALAWAEGTHCAITVCDLEGKVIFMNERSRATFDKDGRTMLGQNLMPCHSEKSQEKIRHMIATDTVNRRRGAATARCAAWWRSRWSSPRKCPTTCASDAAAVTVL